MRVLAARKDVDPSRIGLVGASQAGWIIPRAAARSPLVKFAVVTAGPAVSVGEQGLYAGLTGQGANDPTKAQIDEQLSGAEPSGFDPRPDLEKLTIPMLWLYGLEDKVVYAPQSVAVLQGAADAPDREDLPARGPLPARHAARPERASSPAPTGSCYFQTIAAWLREH